MVRWRYGVVWVVITLLMVGVLNLTPRASQAQSPGSEACPALVELALTQVGNNCANLSRNSACYGFNRVESTFTQPVSQGYFTAPADRADLVDMKTIQSTPLDLALNQWGIAVLNVQANVPDTLPGQAVTFLLMGDTQVENAVDPAQTVAGITVITQTATALRSDPQANSAVVSELGAGTVLQADSLSSDGSAIHVSTDAASGWIDVTSVNPTPQIAALASGDIAARSPMQAFYFRTGPGQTTCSQTPSLLAIQSPENIKVDLTANGANIRLGSLITLEVLPGGDLMKLTTLEGNATLNPGEPDEVSVPAGFSTTHCLADPASLGLDGEANDQNVGDNCEWEPPTPTNLDDLDQGQIVQAMLERMRLAAANTTPTPEITPEATEAVELTDCPTGTTLFHVVSAGENLYRISLKYSTSVGAIMQANSLTDASLIYTGQRLTIPCGLDIGIPALPNVPTALPGSTVSGVDCAPFRATSPLDGLNYGSNTFYWDAAPGADGYRVNIYNIDEKGGALVNAFTSSGGTTNLTADITIESAGYGFLFAWDVQALSNGQVACTSNRYNIPRAPQPAVAGSSGFTAGWSCLSFATLRFDFSNMPSGTSAVVIRYSFSGAGVPTPSSGFRVVVPPDPGKATLFGGMSFTTFNATITAIPSNTTIGLPGSLTC